MAEKSPFLAPQDDVISPDVSEKNNRSSPVPPQMTGGEYQAREVSPFSIRPATSPPTSDRQAPSQGTVPPASTSVKAPQVIKGPAIGGPAQMTTQELLAPDEEEIKKKRRRIFWILLGILSIGGIALSLYWWWQRPIEEIAPTAESRPAAVPSTSQTPTILEQVPPVLLDDTANYRSENFKVGEIVLLGEAQFLQTDEGIAPLSINGIRGEAFTEKNKQEVKLVITWNTNKLAAAEVSYAKGLGQTPKIVQTEDLAYDHSIILTGLDPASTYLYTIKATDRFGNVVTSEPYAVFTGARSVSLFDLIAGAIGEVFGWAVK